MLHHLKINRNHILEITSGRKNFEIRKNDRNFQIGDLVLLHEYDIKNKHFIDNKMLVKITDIFDISDVIPEYIAFTFFIKEIKV